MEHKTVVEYNNKTLTLYRPVNDINGLLVHVVQTTECYFVSLQVRYGQPNPVHTDGAKELP